MKLGVLLRALMLVILTLALAVSSSGIGRVYASTGPLAAFTYAPCFTCAVVGFAVFFNGNWSISTSGSITTYTWNFGDGGTMVSSTGPLAFHDYVFPGNFLVSLKVQDSAGLTDSIVQTVSTASEPAFTFAPHVPMIGQPVIFNATASISTPPTNLILGYNWDFGDGTSGTKALVAHSYSATGNYRVVLTLVTSQGSPSVSKTLSISPLKQFFMSTFQGVTVSLSGFFFVNSTSKTLQGTVMVNAVNTTSGTVLISKTFSINVGLGSTRNIPVLFAVPSKPLALAILCTVNSATNNASCFVSRDPDINGDGRVDIIDAAILGAAYGSVAGSARYNPAADLDANGAVDIVDASILGAYFGAPLFQ